MIRNLIISLIFGGLFIWVAVAGVDFEILGQALATMDYGPLVPFVLLIGVYHALRVWRWSLILGPTYHVPFRRLFSINMVGFMAINLLPARLGEVARPYLLLEKEDIPLGAGLSSVLVERMLDFLTMLLFLAVVVFLVDLPTTTVTVRGETYDIVAVVQQVFLVAALPAVGGLVGLLLFEPWMYRLLHATVGRLFPGLAARGEAFFRSFMDNLRPLKNPRVLLVQVALTLVIWSITPTTEWLMFRVFHLNSLGVGAALTVVATLLVGMLIPAPPGFAGNFEAFTMAGLAVYGVTGGVALGYALVLHWSQFLLIFLTGMFFLYKDEISFRSVVRFSREVKRGVGRVPAGSGERAGSKSRELTE